MNPRSSMYLLAAAIATALMAAACERDTSGLRPAPFDTDPVVFDDDFGDDVIFEPFLNTKLEPLSVDEERPYEGTASLRVVLPAPGHPSEWYTGGAFTTEQPRDFSGYDALTFFARASREVSLDVVGIGNDNTGTSRFEATWSDLPVTPAWQRYVVPIPLPERMASERGPFFLAEGHDGVADYEIWLDEIRYERVGTITPVQASMTTQTKSAFVGGTVSPEGTQTVFAVGGADPHPNRIIEHMPGYFTFFSSDDSVARIADGEIRVVGPGAATITAALGEMAVAGSLMVRAELAPESPATPPTLPASRVISLFSNVYADRPVDTWSASWGSADLSEIKVAGDDVKAYTNLAFTGIEFTSENTIDASAMTHFHLDVWLPIPTLFRVKLVDFGPDNEFGGGDDREHELSFPITAPKAWVGLEIPLSDFSNLISVANLAQLVISGPQPTRITVFLDNIYFHD